MHQGQNRNVVNNSREVFSSLNSSQEIIDIAYLLNSNPPPKHECVGSYRANIYIHKNHKKIVFCKRLDVTAVHAGVHEGYKKYLKSNKASQEGSQEYVAAFINHREILWRIEGHQAELDAVARGEIGAKQNLANILNRYKAASELCQDAILNGFLDKQVVLAESSDRLIIAKMLGFSDLTIKNLNSGIDYIFNCFTKPYQSNLGAHYYDQAIGSRILTIKIVEALAEKPQNPNHTLEKGFFWVGNAKEFIFCIENIYEILHKRNAAGTPELQFLIADDNGNFKGDAQSQKSVKDAFEELYSDCIEYKENLWEALEVPDKVTKSLSSLISIFKKNTDPTVYSDRINEPNFVKSMSQALRSGSENNTSSLEGYFSSPMEFLPSCRIVNRGDKTQFLFRKNTIQEIPNKVRYFLIKNVFDQFKKRVGDVPDWVAIMRPVDNLPLESHSDYPMCNANTIESAPMKSFIIEAGKLGVKPLRIVFNTSPYSEAHIVECNRRGDNRVIKALEKVDNRPDVLSDLLTARRTFRIKAQGIITKPILPSYSATTQIYHDIDVPNFGYERDFESRPYIEGKRFDNINLCDEAPDYLLQKLGETSIAYQLGYNVLGPDFFLGTPAIDISKILLSDKLFSINSADSFIGILFPEESREDLQLDYYKTHKIVIALNFVAFISTAVKHSRQSVSKEYAKQCAASIESEVLNGMYNAILKICSLSEIICPRLDRLYDKYDEYCLRFETRGEITDLKLRRFKAHYVELLKMDKSSVLKLFKGSSYTLLQLKKAKARYSKVLATGPIIESSDTLPLLRNVFSIFQRYKESENNFNFDSYSYQERTWFLSLLDIELWLKAHSLDSITSHLLELSLGVRDNDQSNSKIKNINDFVACVNDNFFGLRLTPTMAEDFYRASNGINQLIKDAGRQRRVLISQNLKQMPRIRNAFSKLIYR